MDEKAIYPTLKCFDDALDFLWAVLRENPDDREELLRHLFLVHGLCRAPDGHLYAHAWVEDDLKAQCIFRGILRGTTHYFSGDRGQYYAEVQVTERTRYSVAEALAQNRAHGTFGPWVPQYRALCRQPEAPSEVQP